MVSLQDENRTTLSDLRLIFILVHLILIELKKLFWKILLDKRFQEVEEQVKFGLFFWIKSPKYT